MIGESGEDIEKRKKKLGGVLWEGVSGTGDDRSEERGKKWMTHENREFIIKRKLERRELFNKSPIPRLADSIIMENQSATWYLHSLVSINHVCNRQ